MCDDRLVPSLESLCAKWEMKEDVAGSTLMAIGSSAPEIVISCLTSISGGTDLELGIGSILGYLFSPFPHSPSSGLMAFLGVPCACALFAGRILEIKRRALIRDFLVYLFLLLLSSLAIV